ncbi:BrnA antitoxin family protein [Novosphingobium sp. MD-1]|uniref:BrnA antitoxin family protein n=1 Tax=Novosphingobium sp. MD-1 TaxID=1630648 RepID=UPI00061BB0FD|nr:BrnA antitoxin family protein [Novosphingobium sp. MD-1]GAO52963.1 hypothetical protein NMD1_02620 [Novosphingobium sp. MD-1]
MPDERPVVFDDDNPEWTAEDFARSKPLEAFPELASALLGRPGRPSGWRKAKAKQSVTIRLSPDVLEKLRASGKGWQTRIDDMLRHNLGL